MPGWRRRLAEFLRQRSEYSYTIRNDQVQITLPRVEWELLASITTFGAKTGAANHAINGEMVEEAESLRLEKEPTMTSKEKDLLTRTIHMQYKILDQVLKIEDTLTIKTANEIKESAACILEAVAKQLRDDTSS